MKKIKLGKIKIKKKESKPKVKNDKKKNVILSTILIAGISVVSLILVFMLYIIITAPEFDKDKLFSQESTVLYYADGVTELARIGHEDIVLVSYDELPANLINAIIATEDSRFFEHKGMDMARFAKATLLTLLGSKKAGGASTLTMQLVKRHFTSDEKDGIEGIIRKFTDIYMAVFKIESNYTKEEILEFYVNSQWFAGGSLNYTGTSGVEQACQYFFGKSVKDISLAEASIIAGMFQNPARYNPYKYPERIRQRQNIVLTLMVNHGYITEEEKEAVLAIPIESLILEDKSVSSENQAVIDYVLNDVFEKTGYNPSKTAMKIVTTIKPEVQDVLNQLEKGELYKFPNNAMQEGIVVTSTEDGSIVALSGGRNYSAKGNNRALAKRQPGSTAKILFDYGPYIEYLGGSPATYLLDEETTYSNGQKLKNADDDYLGLNSMREMLSRSRNIPALRAFKEVYKENPDYIKDFVHSLGINYGSELYESASIGGFDGISPLQMSAAYGAFARGGYYIEPYSFTKVTINETEKVIEYEYEKEKVMSEETAFMITDILKMANDRGVTGVKIAGIDIAGKTGTTNIDNKTAEAQGLPKTATRDAWNVSYSPQYTIALWIGYDRVTSENYLTTNIGSKVRLAVMKAIGQKIYTKKATFKVPSGVIQVEIEKDTIPLQLPSEYTPADMRITDWFKEGTEPTEVSTRYEKLKNPSEGKYTFNGTSLKLSWTGIPTPDAISTSYLQDYFNTYYTDNITKCYEKRLDENKQNIGTLGYQIYEKSEDGTLKLLGRSEGTSYTINNPTPGNITYVIKSAYSIFKDNMSDGLEIKTNSNMDSNVGDIVDGGNNNDNNNPGEDNPDTGLN